MQTTFPFWTTSPLDQFTIRNLFSLKAFLSNKYVNHGTLVELVWTITPALILVLIAFPSFKLLFVSDHVSFMDINPLLNPGGENPPADAVEGPRVITWGWGEIPVYLDYSFNIGQYRDQQLSFLYAADFNDGLKQRLNFGGVEYQEYQYLLNKGILIPRSQIDWLTWKGVPHAVLPDNITRKVWGCIKNPYVEQTYENRIVAKVVQVSSNFRRI